MPQLWKLRTPLAAVLVAGTAMGSLWGQEPLAAPPSPVLTASDEAPAIQESGAGSPRLAPVSTDAGVVPAAQRAADRSLAPVTIGGEPAYLPGPAGNAALLYPTTTPQLVSGQSATPLPAGAVVSGDVSGEMIYSGDGMPYGDGQIIYGGEGVGYGGEMIYGDVPHDEATVRISDRSGDQANGQVPGVRPSNRICPECRYCQHGLPYHQCPHCEPDPRMVRQYRRKHGVCYPPDYGWSPPANYPIDRISIDYYRAFPAAWNGQAQPGPAVVRPTVYWPTDTTQLGYTYQHSPRWMPYPGMVPPVPHPGQWHLLHYGQHQGGPCPNCRGNAAVPPAQQAAAPRQSQSRGQPTWAPTDVPQAGLDVAELPIGPALEATDGTPLLTPVPF